MPRVILGLYSQVNERNFALGCLPSCAYISSLLASRISKTESSGLKAAHGMNPKIPIPR